jgi:16S rRNA (uracil1498-N3)-methyltransferase
LAADAAPALLYVPDLPGPGGRVTLTPEDAHYVARVCRARAGESLEATDGRGMRAALRLLEVRSIVTAEVESVRRDEPGRRAWMLCGAPEGERGDWLIEKLAELGIERLVPVDTARAAWRHAGSRRARWERVAVAALRQSRRTRLMTIVEPMPLAEAVAMLPAGARWLADARGEPAGGTSAGPVGWCAGLVGPAPGLDPAERERVRAAGFRGLCLSDARLRAETAALAWACWWAAGAAAGDEGPNPG